MDFRLLGPVGLWDGDDRIALGRGADLPKAQCVLAVLLLAKGGQVTENFLDRALWGGASRNPETRRGYVGDLRTALRRHGFTLPRHAHGTYRLEVAPELVDVHRFRAAVDAARVRITAGDWAAARDELAGALALWRGPALHGVPGAWADGVRRGLERERRQAATRLAEARLRCGEAEQARLDGERLTTGHPGDEPAVRVLMHAAYLTGDYGAALEAYERLGAGAGPATRALADRIRARDPLLGTPGEPPAAVAVVPRQLPAVTGHFAGRDAQLERLAELTGPAEPHAPLVLIYGTAGVGKTTLAVHWARRAAGDHPHGQLHADLLGRDPGRTPREPASVLRGFLVALGVPADRLPSTEEDLGGLFRSLAADRRLLVVLENPDGEDQVRALLPGTPSCRTVVTSRTRLPGLHADPGAEVLTLDLLDEAGGRALLAARLGAGRIAGEDRAVVAELIRLCAGLPLALAIVAARMAEQPGPAPADLVAQLCAEGRRLDVIATGDGRTDPRAAFAWSYRRLPAPAARLFRLLARHPGPDFAAPAAASLLGAPEPAAAAALAELASAHLVGVPEPGRYAMHALLRDYAAELDHGEPAATVRLYDHYLHTAAAADRLLRPYAGVPDEDAPADGTVVTPIADEDAASGWLRREALNLAELARQALRVGLPRHAVRIPQRCATYQIRHGHYREYHDAQLIALAGADRLGDPADRADALIELGRALGWLSATDEALRRLDEAEPLVTGAERNYRLRMAQAWLLGERGRPVAALAAAEQALEAALEAGNPRAVAVTRNEIGWCNVLLDRLGPALRSCERALADFERLADAGGIAASADSLGLIHHRAGRFDAALAHYGRALEIYERLPDVYEQAATLDRMGDTLAATGRGDEAAAAWQRALQLLNGLQHADGARVSEKLALRTPAGPNPGTCP